jgi:hypothetical protein
VHDVTADQHDPIAAHPSVTRLAQGTEVLRRVIADRPVLVADALLDGVPPEQVASALGWELDEVQLAVGRWAARLRREGRLTDAAYANLLGIAPGSQ